MLLLTQEYEDRDMERFSIPLLKNNYEDEMYFLCRVYLLNLIQEYKVNSFSTIIVNTQDSSKLSVPPVRGE